MLSFDSSKFGAGVKVIFLLEINIEMNQTNIQISWTKTEPLPRPRV